MHATIEDAIARVEQLYTTITGHAPPEPNGSGARIPPETDPARHVEEQLEKLIALAEELTPRRAPAGAPAVFRPRVSAWRDDGGLHLAIEIPGIERENVEVRLAGVGARIEPDPGLGNHTKEERTMETVKVDIQKLQLLNDRIAQTIEALNQMRMSVHGIQQAWAQQPWAQQPWTQQPWGFGPHASAPFAPQYQQPFAPWQGMSHTSAPMQPWTTPQWTTPQWTTPQWTTPQWTTPQWSTPFTTGLAHTTWEPSWQTRTPTTYPWTQGWWTTPTTF